MRRYFWQSSEYWGMGIFFIVGFIGFMFDINGGYSGNNGLWTPYCYISAAYCIPGFGIALSWLMIACMFWVFRRIGYLYGKLVNKIKGK
jgi:hypothetical protein